jgi:mRNA interferase MazF
MQRGEIFAFRPPRGAVGREQKGARLAVVVQSDAFRHLSTVTVVPTSTSAGEAIFRPRVTVGGRRTALLVDQVSTVDRARVGRRVGHLRPADLEVLEEALGLYLGLC